MDNVYHIQLPRDVHLQNVKEHYQKNKEEMQKKGRIKMAKRKNKDIDTSVSYTHLTLPTTEAV